MGSLPRRSAQVPCAKAGPTLSRPFSILWMEGRDVLCRRPRVKTRSPGLPQLPPVFARALRRGWRSPAFALRATAGNRALFRVLSLPAESPARPGPGSVAFDVAAPALFLGSAAADQCRNRASAADAGIPPACLAVRRTRDPGSGIGDPAVEAERVRQTTEARTVRRRQWHSVIAAHPRSVLAARSTAAGMAASAIRTSGIDGSVRL